MKISDSGKAKITRPHLPGMALGGLMLVFAGWLVQFGIAQKTGNDHLRETCTVEVAGVVAGYAKTGEYRDYGDRDERHDSRRDYPVFEYTVDGKTYTRQSKRYDAQGQWRYAVGQALPVFRDPDDPERVYIPAEDATENAWWCIGFGSALIVFSGFALVRLVALSRELA